MAWLHQIADAAIDQLEKIQAIQAQYEQVMSALEAKHMAMMRQLHTLQRTI